MPHLFSIGPLKIVTDFVIKHTSKIKRKFVLWILSMAGTVFCSICLYNWTTVPTYTHVFALEHPFSADTTNTHFVFTDIRLHINDAFALQSRNDNPYHFKDKFAVKYDNRPKKANTTLPQFPYPSEVNNYILSDLFGEGRDSISKQMNLIAYAHLFCGDVDDILNFKHVNEKDRTFNEDESGKKHPYYYWHLHNDSIIYYLPFYKKLISHLQYVPFLRDIQYSLSIKMSDSDDKPTDERFILEQERKLTNWEKLKLLFSRNHDVSKARYLVFYQMSGIDSTSIKIIFNENVEFSAFGGGGEPTVERDRVIYSFNGDQISPNSIYASQFHVRFLESQNAQNLRMLLLTTLLAFSLASLLKISVDYVLKIYSKITKA